MCAIRYRGSTTANSARDQQPRRHGRGSNAAKRLNWEPLGAVGARALFNTGIHARVERRSISGWAGINNSAAARRTLQRAELRGHLNIAHIVRAISVPPAIESGTAVLRVSGWHILSLHYVRVTAQSPSRGWGGLLARHGSFDHQQHRLAARDILDVLQPTPLRGLDHTGSSSKTCLAPAARINQSSAP